MNRTCSGAREGVSKPRRRTCHTQQMEPKSWQLVRAALIKIGDEASPQIGNLQLDSVGVVRTRNVRIKGRPLGAICIASVPVELEPNSDIAALLSGQARRDAEAALEFLARLSAIEIRSTHELSSPLPFIGLASDNMDDLAQLDEHPVALESGVMRIRPEVEASMSILEAVDTSVLGDRIEGVALLAEALNSQSPLGRYSQLMRLFESAFRLGPYNLTEPLVNFLANSEHCFKAEEVKQWTDARAFALHADRRPEIYLDSDVRPFEPRMLEAGYDVLLNKEKWRSKSSDRRHIWRAPSGTKGANNEGVYLARGQAANLKAHVFDGFMAYPMITAGPFIQALPKAAWLMGDIDGGKLEVAGDWEGEVESVEDDQSVNKDQ